MNQKTKITSVIAKEADGTIQITFTVPFAEIKKAEDETISEYAKTANIPGFRPGKAPLEKVAEKIPQAELIEHSLGHILPKAVGAVVTEQKLKIAIYPKFELISAKEGEDWQIRAITCEIPEVSLGDYKKNVSALAKAKAIWTPDKGKEEAKPQPSKEEKEQEIIKFLLDSIKVTIAKVLIDEEVNARLASLLDRIEKLGLSLDSYLASLGKTPEALRAQYEAQAKNSIALELILGKIAEEEKIKIEESQIDEVLKASAADPKLYDRLNSPEQRKTITAVLRRRYALDSLISLI